MNSDQKKINSYKDLLVWQKSIELTLEIYALTNNFPKHEIYGLTSQMRRAAVSVPSNIAEGSRRGSKKEYKRFVRNSLGSGAELETQLILSLKLMYCNEKEIEETKSLLNSIMKMLNRLATSLEDKK